MLPRDAGLLGSYGGSAAHGHPDSVHRRSGRSVAPEVSQDPLHLPLSCFQKPLWAYWRRLSVRLWDLHALPAANRKLVSFRSLEARLLLAALDDGFGVCPALSKTNARYGQGTHFRRRLCPRLLASPPRDNCENSHRATYRCWWTSPLLQGWGLFPFSIFRFLSSRIPLLFPGIPVRVITIPFPKPQSVVVQQRKSSHPLYAFPRIQMRHHQSQRPAMLRSQRRAVMLKRKKHIGTQQICQRHICRVAFFRQ